MRAFVSYDQPKDRWLLLLLNHHLVEDNTSLRFLMEEIHAYQHGYADQLPVPLPFRNFIAQTRLGVTSQEHEIFFHTMLKDVDETTAPFGLMDVQGDGSDIKEAQIRLDDNLAQRIRQQARFLGVSAASLFHLAWAQVLAKTSGREMVVFGTVLFGRMQGGAGSNRLLGMFINTLPLRIDIDDVVVIERVRQVHALLSELLHHEHAPLALAQRCSSVPKGMPLFTALLNYRHRVEKNETSGGIALEGVEILSVKERTNYPITLSVDDLGVGFSLTAQTQSPVEAERVCDFIKTAIEKLVDALETTPDVAICSLDILPIAEQQILLHHWNATEANYPKDKCVHELFELQVAKTPDSIALVYEEESLTYSELNAKANQLARYLQELGVGTDRLVGICLERGLNMMIGLLAILKAGGAYVPLDPTYPKERLSFMLKDSVPVALLVEPATRVILEEVAKGIPSLDLVDNQFQWSKYSQANIECQTIGLAPENLAYIIYTSGSTGKPKGVMVSHYNVVRLMQSTQPLYQFNEKDVWTLFHSYGFDFSVWEIWGALFYGGSLVIVPYYVSRNPEAFYQLLEKENVTVLNQTPSAFRQLMAVDELQTKELRLRWVIFGGEALELQSLEGWYERHGDKVPQLVNMYGITETTVHVTYRVLDKNDLNRGSVIGRPIADLSLYILDQHQQLTPIGIAGEIYVGGAGVAKGYLNKEELTATKFINLPHVKKGRLYRSGDLARYLANGDIQYLGRTDHQVKIRGFRIELGEIEAQLAIHPAIDEVTVQAREDATGDKRLVAYYTSKREVSVEELRSHLIEVLPEYMVPAAYVEMQAMPLTPNGKLDRKALPIPEGDAYTRHTYEIPIGKTEQTIASIWSKLLKIDKIGRHDNFFELGGHSLLIIELLGLLKLEGIESSVGMLFKNPTIKSFSASISQQKDKVIEQQAIPLRQTGTQRPLFLVHELSGEVFYGLGLTQYVNADIPVYGLMGQPLGEVFYQTMPALAMRLIPMIRAIQPKGPYRLAGWSFGGTLAYEIATQLIGADETVEFLGFFDSYYFQGIPKNSRLVLPIIDEDDKSDIALLLYLIKAHSPVTIFDETKLAATDLPELVSKCQDLSLLPAHLTVNEIHFFLSRLRSNSKAATHYLAYKLPIATHLFAAQDPDQYNLSIEYPLKGWDSVLPKEQISLIPIQGSHQSMVKSPHVEFLGEALSRAIDKASGNKIELSEFPYCPLITMQAGKLGVKPIFCVPGAGSSVASLRELTDAFDLTRPVYGLQPRGLDEEMVPHSTVAAAANSYIEAIKSVYPDGALHLLGHSFGGWVVFDMAQKLTASGRTVASVTLLDTEVPDEIDSTIREYSTIDILMKLVEIYQQSANMSMNIHPSAFDGLDSDEQQRLLHQHLVNIGLIPKSSKPEILEGTLRTFSVALRTHYSPTTVYSGKVNLVLALDQTLDKQKNLERNEEIVEKWRKYASNIVYWQTQANHMTVLKSPHINELVAWLQLD
jgi:amino acid adenylation domain-containing protein